MKSVVDIVDGPLSVAFVGDTGFGESYQAVIEKRGGTNILKAQGYAHSLNNFAPFLRQAHQVVANLETPLTDLPQSPLKGRKPYLHWSDVHKAPLVLREHNINAVSLANNHTLDYGIEGLRQSLAALAEHDIAWSGAGPDAASAARPLRFDYRLAGRLFRLVVATGYEYRKSYKDNYAFYVSEKNSTAGVNAWPTARAGQQIEALRLTNPDAFIVAYPHFGKNYAWKSEKQTALAHSLIDGGADLVIGHGAHMMQQVERYKGRWIVYSLGNFAFNSPGRYATKQAAPFSLVARLEVAPIGDGFAQELRLYPIFCDNLVTEYRSHFVSTEHFTQVHKLLLEHSGDAAELQQHLRTGQDTFGHYFSVVP